MTRPSADEIPATLPASGVSGGDSPGADPHVPPGGRLGRYIMLGKLGAGAMGVVYSAHDPELDRKVAIKLLKGGEWDEDGSRHRLQREAQALARLAHPNVVSVYDVGMHGGQLFLAMEFVAGQTLGDWMRSVEQPHPWREVVRVFLPAGRGLAAAHAEDLIHRDFKPDNVMLGDDGKVRVMDFGLARTSPDPSAERQTDEREPSSQPAAALASELTQTGTMVGTPAYMSAEQLNRRPADARSDQFGFCVALYEALYGERPFRSGSLIDLILAVNEDEVRDPSVGSVVPAWLRKVVVRGLASEPESRHPSMQALLEALASDPATKRRSRVIAGGGALAAVVGVTSLVVALRQPAPEACTGMEDKIAAVWSDTRKSTIGAAMTATGLSYAESTWARVQDSLDTYAAQWVTLREDACLATHRGEQSAELLDLRMACLDGRLAHLTTTIDVLSTADQSMVDNAILAVTSLPKLERCADLEALTAERPPPEDPVKALRVVELDGRLAQATALRDAAKYDAGQHAADAIAADAADVGYAPLSARAWLLVGQIQVQRGDYDPAAASLVKAYDFALGERMHEEAASASALLMHMFGYYREQHEQARSWAVQADPLSRAVGTDEARALFLNNRGAMALAEGKPELARADHERALELRLAALGDDHPDVAASLTYLGTVARDLGHGNEALGYHERALAIRKRVFGPDHPQVGASLYNLGSAARTTGQLAQARQWLLDALEIRRGALGEGHPYVASTLYQLGGVARLVEDYETSRQRHEAALAIWDRTLGADHPDVAWAHSDLGLGALARGDLTAARERFTTALEIREKSLGPSHPLLSKSLNALGEVALEQEAYDEARDLHARALEVAQRAESSSLRAASMLGLGVVSLERGDYAAAITHLERALVIGEAGPQGPGRVDEIRFALARTLWVADVGRGQDRVRARELASAATFDEGDGAKHHRAKRDAWVAGLQGER